MIYLDTHIVVWLYAGQIEKLNEKAIELINENEILISPIVRLELQDLLEIKRITETPDNIITDLSNSIGLKICDKAFNNIVNFSMRIGWTRDPFDRLIVANAAIQDDYLITKDQTILSHYSNSLY